MYDVWQTIKKYEARKTMVDLESGNFMAYQILMKKETDLLRYFVTGERSFTSAYQLWERIYRDCAKTGINRVHVTVTLSGQLDKMEFPLLMHKLIQLNNNTPITCAWVDHNPQSFRDNLLAERIPRPKSMNIRIFNTDADAVDWLAQEESLQ